MKLHNIPTRLATGAFILNSGLNKWNLDEESAAGLQGMATGTYPFLKDLEPATFGKALAAGEIATGALLLAPFVPARVAGLALTAFSGGLMGMYLKIPGMREEGSLAPTQDGTALAKDVWMLGIGASLLMQSSSKRSKSSK